MNALLLELNEAAIKLTQKVVVISVFLAKGDANMEQQRYFADELRKAVDNFNSVYWPGE